MTDDLRARKKRETCEALRSAALRLVDAHGLEHVTVEMIAAAVDVSPRTFFNYFSAKEDALLGPGADVRAEIDAFWSQRPADEAPLVSLRALLLDRARSLSTQSREMTLRMRVLADNPALHVRFHASFLEVERTVRVAVARRCGLDERVDLYPALLAAAGSTAMRVAIELWHAGGERDLADTVDRVFDLYASGLEQPAPRPPAPLREHPVHAKTGA